MTLSPLGVETSNGDENPCIAAGRGLEAAVVQSTQIGAVNSWLRNQPTEVVSAAIASLPRGAGGASGRRERAPARCDVAGQQCACLYVAGELDRGQLCVTITGTFSAARALSITEIDCVPIGLASHAPLD